MACSNDDASPSQTRIIELINEELISWGNRLNYFSPPYLWRAANLQESSWRGGRLWVQDMTLVHNAQCRAPTTRRVGETDPVQCALLSRKAPFLGPSCVMIPRAASVVAYCQQHMPLSTRRRQD
ncbi:unnamed protein product [Trichogramma brassicae]|uniref:Uncharacterized protein n=1 Tax=Trichogramma brassicae TaxID=86971 RepID=A0A6H5I0F4_9HYME|nr:unnamed protein product [Trichogramma brassicae]